MKELRISWEQVKEGNTMEKYREKIMYMRDMLKAVFEYDTKPIDHGTLKTYKL